MQYAINASNKRLKLKFTKYFKNLKTFLVKKPTLIINQPY